MRSIEKNLFTVADLQSLNAAIEGLGFPCVVKIRAGSKRTLEQQDTAWMWHREAQEQGDMTADEYRAFCKLHVGVPIMMRHDEYRDKYAKYVAPLSYEQKLNIMAEPYAFPVTSAMTVKEHGEYLDGVQSLYTEMGFRLTEPKKTDK